jgi:transposase
MLTVETIRKIRLASKVKQQSIRQIAKEFNLSRNTIRKVLRSEQTAFVYRRDKVHRPRLGPHIEQLESWLEADQGLPAKRRRNAMVLYEGLQEHGYRGGYDSVRRYVKHWREMQRQQVVDAFVPLSFEPGEAFQFDWSGERVVLGGITTAIKVAQIRLCYSRMFFVVAYVREAQEMVFDAHGHGFEFFGGVCRRGLYDNMKTAVLRVLRGKQRDFNQRFEQLCAHYLFEPVACTPAAGWEKGQVEKQVGTVRGRFFTPTRHAKDLATLNTMLRSDCIAWAKTRRHPEQRDKTVWEVFQAEQSHLIPLSRPFDGYAERCVRVSPTALVSFDRNRYSVDARCVGRGVQLRSYADRIVVVHEGEVIGAHRRSFKRDQMIFDPWHYLLVLKRKPGALRNGAPFKQWDLPHALQRTWAALKRYGDWDRQFVDILAAVPYYGMEAVTAACEQALLSGSVSRDVVLNILSRQRDEPCAEPMAIPPHLVLSQPPQADCQRYDRYLREA